VVKRCTMRLVLCAVLLLPSFISVHSYTLAAEINNDYPWRAQFQHLKTIGIDKLADSFEGFVIIDVRSFFEYEVLHINHAINIPVHEKRFEQKLQTAVPRQNGRIIFYCNGHSCPKSYKAADKALKIGYTNIRVFDGGVYDWADRFPQKTTMLWKTPVKKGVVIPQFKFLSHQVSYKKFISLAKQESSVIIDIRHDDQRFNRSGDLLSLEALRGISRSRHRRVKLIRIKNLLLAKAFKGRTLLFYDGTGNQTKSLQYILESVNHGEYYFLKGGVLRVIGADGFL
jgi:rhodanese-related sulfurtransferase